MKATEIRDHVDLETWLEGQSREVYVWIAARAAARALPIYWQEVAQNITGQTADLTALPVFRAVLTAASFAYAEDDAVRDRVAASAPAALSAAVIAAPAAPAAPATSAAAAATNAAYAAVNAAPATARAAKYAAECAALAADDASCAYATFADVRWVESHGLTADRPLWPEGMPDEIAQAWQATLRALPEAAGDQPDYRSFWVPWYQGLLDGKPAFPRALTEAVALIPEDDWKQGDLHINNTVIPTLMAAHAQSDAVRGERIERAASGALTRVVITDLPEDIRTRAVDRTLDALDDLRHMAQEGGNQIYAIFLPSVSVIERAVGRAGRDSVRLFETLEDATTRIETIAREQGLSDDAEVTVVLANFERSRHEIWNGDPVVREVQTVGPGPSPEALPPETQCAVQDIGVMVEEEADADLAQDMAGDGKELEDPDGDPIERRRALQRHAGRILQALNIWVFEGSDKIRKIKTAVEQYGWFGAVIYALWQIVKGMLT